MGDYIYIYWSPENQRIPNVCRIAGVAQQQSNSCVKLEAKITFDPNIIEYNINNELKCKTRRVKEK